MKLYQFIYLDDKNGLGRGASHPDGFYDDSDESVIELAKNHVVQETLNHEVLIVELQKSDKNKYATGGVTRLVAYVKRGQPQTIYPTEVTVY